MAEALKNKVAIITGAGRGIGAACAALFAEQGAKVVLASRTESEILAVAASITSRHGPGRALTVKCDVSQEAEVQELFKRSLASFGPVDILVNNAGAIVVSPIESMTLESWEQVMSVNIRGTFLCSREAFRQIRSASLVGPHKGAIINLSSLGGIRGTEKFKGMSAYVAAKFGIVGLTESLAVEGKELGIRVNCVAPGAVDTQMLREAAPFLKTETTPLDVAKVIFFLADEQQSKAMNGSVLEIFSNA